MSPVSDRRLSESFKKVISNSIVSLVPTSVVSVVIYALVLRQVNVFYLPLRACQLAEHCRQVLLQQ